MRMSWCPVPNSENCSQASNGRLRTTPSIVPMPTGSFSWRGLKIGAKVFIVDARSWGNAEVKRAAAEALGIAAGIHDAYGFVIDIYRRGGAKSLTEPQLSYLTLWWLDAEVRNGGFSQYYLNSSGELAHPCGEGRQDVGATELAGIIQKANSLFGKNGRSPDRDKPWSDSAIDLKAIGNLDTSYYKNAERLDELLPRFVARNAEAFKAAK